MTLQALQLRRAADRLEAHPVVADARLVESHADGERTEIVLERGVDRVPPGVLRQLAECDCGLECVCRQGEYLVATVR